MSLHYPQSRTQARIFAAQIISSLNTVDSDFKSLLALVSTGSEPVRSAPHSEEYLFYLGALLNEMSKHDHAFMQHVFAKRTKHHPVPHLHQVIVAIAEISARPSRSALLFDDILLTLAESLLTEEEARVLLKEIGNPYGNF